MLPWLQHRVGSLLIVVNVVAEPGAGTGAGPGPGPNAGAEPGLPGPESNARAEPGPVGAAGTGDEDFGLSLR